MRESCSLRIADIQVKILGESSLKMPNSFAIFKVEEEAGKDMQEGSDAPVQYEIRFRIVPELKVPDGICVYEERETGVYLSEDRTYFRVFKDYYTDQKVYAIGYYDWDQKVILIECQPENIDLFKNVQVIFKHVAWETLLLKEERLMLHASYLRTPFGGIAFSGASGIGKSTQAGLWCQYEQAEMLNGDKVILREKDDRWIGYGSPYAGSSSCYVNDSCELNGLFFLKQGKTCSLRKLTLSESVKQIYTGLTLNRWDGECVKQACDLAEKLAKTVPVYEFICTPDEQAVHFLKKKLEGGEIPGVD